MATNEHIERWVFEADESDLTAASKAVTKQLKKLGNAAEDAGDDIARTGRKTDKRKTRSIHAG